MESFEGGVAVEGEAVGLVEEGLGFGVARVLVSDLENIRDWVYSLLTIDGMLREG